MEQQGGLSAQQDDSLGVAHAVCVPHGVWPLGT